MQKEKKIGTYQRRTKSGKTVTVKAHSAKYDAAEAAKEAMKNRKGSGSELAARTLQAKSSEISADDFKAWYHWDAVDDPKNAAALRAEKGLKSQLGAAGYKKFFNSATESYSARGHSKAFKSLGTSSAKPVGTKNTAKSSTPAKEKVSHSKTDDPHEGYAPNVKKKLDALLPKVVSMQKEWWKKYHGDSNSKGGGVFLKNLNKYEDKYNALLNSSDSTKEVATPKKAAPKRHEDAEQRMGRAAAMSGENKHSRGGGAAAVSYNGKFYAVTTGGKVETSSGARVKAGSPLEKKVLEEHNRKSAGKSSSNLVDLKKSEKKKKVVMVEKPAEKESAADKAQKLFKAWGKI